MKNIRPMKNLVLILLLLQWGIAPCAGACGKASCLAVLSVNHAVSAPADHACHACAGTKASEPIQPKLSNTGSCCQGAPNQLPILSPQLLSDPGPALHSSMIPSAEASVCPITTGRSRISHSGEPPPSRSSHAIYQTLCDLRI